MTRGEYHSLDAHLAPAAAVGVRARRLARMAAAGLPVPRALALDTQTVAGIAEGAPAPPAPEGFGPVVSIRPAPMEAGWGGPPAFLNVGLARAGLTALAARVGDAPAWEAYRRQIAAYGTRIHGLDPTEFENRDLLGLAIAGPGQTTPDRLAGAEAAFREATGADLPQTPASQRAAVLRDMAASWAAPSARLLREARGAPPDAGLSLIVQEMVFGLGPEGGAGQIQSVSSQTGAPGLTGRFLPDAEGPDARRAGRTPHLITTAERVGAGQTKPALEELMPSVLDALVAAAARIDALFGDRMVVGFVVERGAVWILDAWPVRRRPAAAVRIAADLGEAGTIDRDRALGLVDPLSLGALLHPQIAEDARRDVIGSGLAASPGAGAGRIAFTPDAAQQLHARGHAAILVRRETSPDDIRGMHVAAGALTLRGGMTSHAAVIARGLGRPCVVNATGLTLDTEAETLSARDGRVFRAGSEITVDGTRGQILAGSVAMHPPDPGPAFDTLMAWADARRTLGVRANADTPRDAAQARRFGADGIGLCRTEHTVFEAARIDAMRAVILTDDADRRAAALDTLRRHHQRDFVQLFATMRDRPVTIRLLDPPLHEFLPYTEAEIARLARAMGQSVAAVTNRSEELREFNPMLGRRGVRLGITVPEIYDMQARAILEAALAEGGEPEIMIPLVSAWREVELVKARVAEVAEAVRTREGRRPVYRLGVMVETPRGALRAGDLARATSFLSFGTNDLTQMTYGLSRDDAGRFMRDYVALGVFPEDPFHSLDRDGVGELLTLAVARSRAANPLISIGLCGEHGGDPASIAFCQEAGFDYVSCSPYRVPTARLAAAQAALIARIT